MSFVNAKFIQKNMQLAAKIRIPTQAMFSAGVVGMLDEWQSYMRMDALCIAIALLNIVATTLEYSFVQRSADNRHRFPLNLYNIIVARSCMLERLHLDSSWICLLVAYGKSDVSSLVRNVLSFIRSASGAAEDVCLDEFTKAGLMDALRKCTKVVITDEADMTFADVGLFHCFPKPANENNCRRM